MADTTSLLKAAVKTWVELDPQGDKSAIIDLQESVYDLVEQNHVQAERIRQLDTQLKRRNDLIREGDRYFISEKDNSKSGPVCPKCYEESQVVSSLRETKIPVVGNVYLCAACDTKYFL
jgi:hypothetical protein